MIEHPRCWRVILGALTFALSCASSPAALPSWLDADAAQLLPEVVAARRDFHQNPELSNGEERTAKVVAERLRKLGLEVRTGVAKHGVVALLRGGKPGAVVALRADMDALPVEEAGDLPFKSKQPGVMHACGHDAHTAIGLGVAALFARHQADLPGTIKFLFQPAEEGMPVHYTEEWGAKLMIREGAFDNPTPRAIFALHCQPLATIRRQLRSANGNSVSRRANWLSHRSDQREYGPFRDQGARQDGAWIAPHRGVDAIQVAAAIVTELQTVRSRHTDTQDPVVLTVGTIRGGQRENIIAEQAEMTGTVRTHDTRVQDRVIAVMKQIVDGVAAAHGATAELTYRKGYPASINDPALARQMLSTVQQVVGSSNVVDVQPSMGGEDFAYFAQKAPGLYLSLGVTLPDVEKPAGLHTPHFHVDESALLTGLRTMAAVLWEALTQPDEKAK